jgi:hypothetical protein
MATTSKVKTFRQLSASSWHQISELAHRKISSAEIELSGADAPQD